MQPQTHKVNGHLHTLRSGEQDALEDVGEVPEVEDVVELDGSREEGGGNLLVNLESSHHQLLGELLDVVGEGVD